jgi:two-component system chemotaxis sensor kinase CheA
MTIEDEELRGTFQAASEEHLQKLEAGLLHLEQNPQDLSGLEDLMREAHSLKGDARMLGVKDVATLAHQWEHLLGTIYRQEAEVSSEICDRLYQGLDAIAALVQEAVTGEPSGVDTFHTLASLMGSQPTESQTTSESETSSEAPTPTPEPTPEAPAETEASADVSEEESPAEPPEEPSEEPSEEPTTSKPTPAEPAIPDPANSSSASSSNGEYRIDTIRVETRHLDTLMTQAGELTVTNVRFAHRLAELEEAIALWEDWSREAFNNRINVHQTQRGDREQAIQKLQDLQDSVEQRLEKLGKIVTHLQKATYEDTTRLDTLTNDLEAGIRTLRLLPLSTIFNLMPRMVRDLSHQQQKQVNFAIEGGDTHADKRILEEIKDPLMHIIRNAIDHGLETPSEREAAGKPAVGTLYLRGYQTANGIAIEVEDDGRGLDLDKIRQKALQKGLYRSEELENMSTTQLQALIFEPGFSTSATITEVSGRGVGLDVVRTNVERLKGSIEVESQVGQGCTIRIHLGTTLATAHVLLVECQSIPFALPVEFVDTSLFVSPDDIFAIEGRETILLSEHPVSVVPLAKILELPAASNGSESKVRQASGNENRHQKDLPCIVIKVGEEKLGLLVDKLLDEQDVILKPQSKLLRRIRNIAGATILGTGQVCMVLNPTDLLKSVRQTPTVHKVSQVVAETESQVGSILVVEDSIAIRTQEKRILESAGYEVTTAVDGLDGFNKLQTHPFDAIVSDIQMPNMDGLELTRQIRQNPKYKELPIILVTSMANEEDKRKGAQAGANAYITKSSFNQEVLLETLQRLV